MMLAFLIDQAQETACGLFQPELAEREGFVQRYQLTKKNIL